MHNLEFYSPNTVEFSWLIISLVKPRPPIISETHKKPKCSSPHQIHPLDNPKKITLKSHKTLLITLGQIFEKQKKFRVYINTNNSASHTYFVNDILCFLVSTTLFCRFLSFHTLVGPNSNHLHRSFYSNLHYFKTNKPPTI